MMCKVCQDLTEPSLSSIALQTETELRAAEQKILQEEEACNDELRISSAQMSGQERRYQEAQQKKQEDQTTRASIDVESSCSKTARSSGVRAPAGGARSRTQTAGAPVAGLNLGKGLSIATDLLRYLALVFASHSDSSHSVNFEGGSGCLCPPAGMCSRATQPVSPVPELALFRHMFCLFQ